MKRRILFRRFLSLTLAAGLSSGSLALGGEQRYRYEGTLYRSGRPIDGACDLEFRLYDAPEGGRQIALTIVAPRLAVRQGAYEAELSFDEATLGRDTRWLGIDVRCPAGSGAFVTLPERREVRSAAPPQSASTPIREEVVRPVASATEGAATTASAGGDPATDTGDDEAATYVVRAGDTLSAIARRYYGRASLYRRIFEANRAILSSPDLIFPGQTLTIPRAQS